MASYVATEEELTAVADAIREKGGTQAQLEWPDGYVDAIEDISGGSSYTATISGTGDSTYCYARVNDTGDRYYADGSTFTFTDTDEIVFHCAGSRAGGTITLNGTVVAQDANYSVSYTLASPRTDMAVNMSYGSASSIAVTVPELSITENGKYDVSGYASAVVNVSGGGGPTKIATKSLGTISTTSTTATDTGQTLAITGFDAYDLLICVAHTSTNTNGRHVATVRLLSFAATSNVNTKTSAVIATSTQHYKLSSSGVLSERTGTTAYGVYVSAGTISTSGTRTLTLTIYQRYNSTSSGTINGDYVLDVYGMTLQDLFT